LKPPRVNIVNLGCSLEFILNISEILQVFKKKYVNLGWFLNFVLNISHFLEEKTSTYEKKKLKTRRTPKLSFSWKLVELLNCRFLETSQSEYSKFRYFSWIGFEYFSYSSSFQEEVYNFRVILEFILNISVIPQVFKKKYVTLGWFLNSFWIFQIFLKIVRERV
jgi:hypothetical protein